MGHITENENISIVKTDVKSDVKVDTKTDTKVDKVEDSPLISFFAAIIALTKTATPMFPLQIRPLSHDKMLMFINDKTTGGTGIYNFANKKLELASTGWNFTLESESKEIDTKNDYKDYPQYWG